MLYDAEIMLAFIEEIAEYLPQLRQHLATLAANPRNKQSLEEAHRLAHTIRGSAAMLELKAISDEGHALEQTLYPAVEKKAALGANVPASMLARVDNLERLLEQVKADLSGVEEAPVVEPTP